MNLIYSKHHFETLMNSWFLNSALFEGCLCHQNDLRGQICLVELYWKLLCISCVGLLYMLNEVILIYLK